jgi:hypothetical protein
MRILPRQLKFDNDIPTIAGNADYVAEKELLLTMDEIISHSGIEERIITSFLDIAVFDKAARLFVEDKPILFRLTHKEKLAAQERAVVALRVAILRKHTGLSLRQFAQFLSHSPLYQWFCQINRFDTIKIPSKSTIDDYEKMIPPSLSSDLDRRLLQLASQSGELLEQPVDLSECFMDTTCIKANIHFPVDWLLIRDAIRTLMLAVTRIRKLKLKCRMPQMPKDFTKDINRLSIEMVHTRRVKGGQKRRKELLREMKQLLKVVQGHAQRHHDLLMEKASTALLGDRQVQRLLDQIAQVIEQLPQVVKNAHERIIGGRPVANADKIHSLYDEHVNVIVRHKASAHVEFGNTLLLAEQRNGLIVDWKLFRDSAPADTRLLKPSQERIKQRLEIDIKLTATDRGFDSEANRNYLEKENTFNAICPRNPHLLQERLQEDRFREAQNRRCQTEGRISIVGRCFCGNPMQQKSYAYRNLHMGLSILSHNLWLLARLKIAQTQAQLADQAA